VSGVMEIPVKNGDAHALAIQQLKLNRPRGRAAAGEYFSLAPVDAR
jgi:hypothetical protein